jgi:flagellar motility protein MotE (MotC chaperone)
MSGVLISVLRNVRLVPIVLTATIALFALKALGLVLDAGYLFDDPSSRKGGGDRVEITGAVAAGKPAPAAPAMETPAVPAPSSAQRVFNNRDGSGVPEPSIRPELSAGGSRLGAPRFDITGAVGATPGPPGEEAPAAGGEGAAKKVVQEPPPPANGTPVPLDLDRPVSPAERAILESLQKRRAELDARARELDVRDDLLRAAEKRVGARIDELKELEARVGAAVQQKDEAEVARFKNIVTMYENMKAKDAAKIFDGLDIRVLLDVVKEINPRRMSDILALMAPENAQRLTIELAARSVQKEQTQAADLPKIQGKPSPN